MHGWLPSGWSYVAYNTFVHYGYELGAFTVRAQQGDASLVVEVSLDNRTDAPNPFGVTIAGRTELEGWAARNGTWWAAARRARARAGPAAGRAAGWPRSGRAAARGRTRGLTSHARVVGF